MKPVYVLTVALLGMVLTACSSAVPAVQTQGVIEPKTTLTLQVPPQPTEVSPIQPDQPAESTSLQLPGLTDEQGAVIVVVKPLNLGSSEETIKFEIALDTHSLDLSMDLAPLATLTTDNGQSVQATQWDAPLGGHHVSGTLSFPARVEGKAILDGASKLTLTIKDVDAPERSFAWDLN